MNKRTPQEIITEIERLTDEAKAQELNIYGMEGGKSPRYPETENVLLISVWMPLVEELWESKFPKHEFPDGISYESFWQEGETPQYVVDILSTHGYAD